MKKANHPSFILELKLSALVWQQHILKIRFELARRLYNTTLSYALKQVQFMKESKGYRKQLHLYRETKSKMKRTTNKELIRSYQKELDTCTQSLNEIRQSFGLSEFRLHAYIKKHQHNVKKHIDSNTSQKIASKVWQSIEDVLFKGRKSHFKKYGTMTSVEGKTDKSGIRFRDNHIQLMNSEANLQHTNRESCNQTFHPFLALHNQQIEALKKMKEERPSSIGIKKAS